MLGKISLLIMRVGTGMLLVLWGSLRLFFPSITVAGAALALIAFREHDTLALDSLVKRKG